MPGQQGCSLLPSSMQRSSARRICPTINAEGLSLYIDEFQNFTTGDIEELVTEGRKYGIRLTVAHQIRSKLQDFLKEPTVAMRTKVCFQTTAEDSRAMAPYFPVGGDTIAPDTPITRRNGSRVQRSRLASSLLENKPGKPIATHGIRSKN
jgi:type IV secretory system conjugative DNA transfer VirD4/TraG family protein